MLLPAFKSPSCTVNHQSETRRAAVGKRERGRSVERPLSATCRSSFAYVWIVFSVFSDAARIFAGSGAKSSFAVYWDF